MSSAGAKTPDMRPTIGAELHRELVLRNLSTTRGAILGVDDLHRRLPGLTPTEITAALERLKAEGIVEEKFRLAVKR